MKSCMHAEPVLQVLTGAGATSWCWCRCCVGVGADAVSGVGAGAGGATDGSGPAVQKRIKCSARPPAHELRKLDRNPSISR